MNKIYFRAALALALIAGVFAFAWKEFRSYREGHKQQQEKLERDESKNVKDAKACINIFSVIICYDSGVNVDNADGYAKLDLQAQQDMAEWTYALLWLTVIGTATGAVGLAALLASIDQTRQAIKITREIGNAQLSPYLSSNTGDFCFGWRMIDNENQLTLKTRPFLINYGQTPASKITLKFEIKIYDVITEDVLYLGSSCNECQDLSPNEQREPDCIIIIDENERVISSDKRVRIWVKAEVEWQSVFIDQTMLGTTFILTSGAHMIKRLLPRNRTVEEAKHERLWDAPQRYRRRAKPQ